MKRRDLNPGDVFVYAELPDGMPGNEYWIGRPLYVDGAGVTPWLEGALASTPQDWGGGLARQLLNSPVVLLHKPENRAGTRTEIRDAVSEAIEVLEQLRDSI